MKKNKKEFYNDFLTEEELIAYTELEYQSFDFGDGPMSMNESIIHDFYIQNALLNLKNYDSLYFDFFDNLKDIKNVCKKNNIKKNNKNKKHYLNQIKIKNISYLTYLILEKEKYNKRVYLKKDLCYKRLNSKKIRKQIDLKNGSFYKKI